jgi:hypothetical protein
VTLRRDFIGSPNYSSRGGASVRLCVVHTAEGATTYQSLGAYFQGPVDASSHVGIDDTPGVIGEYVKPDRKAWTAANANPVAVQAELCGFAAWTTAEWDRHPHMLVNAAEWIAEECARFGIPIRRLTPAEAQSTGRGVCQHVDLGAWGGGHFDCGPGFPMQRVLEMAAGEDTTVPPPEEVLDLASLVQYVDKNGVQTYAGIGKDGHLYEYKADGGRAGTPASKENKTWSAYDLTATSAGSAEDKPFAT